METATNTKTVILVDDDRTNATLIQMLLEMDGFTVVVCPDVQRARDASESNPDAYIIDCNLAQEGDGIDLLNAIRQGHTAAAIDVPIIVTSGDDRRLNEAVKAGATLFMLKPYSPSILSQKLDQLIH